MKKKYEFLFFLIAFFLAIALIYITNNPSQKNNKSLVKIIKGNTQINKEKNLQTITLILAEGQYSPNLIFAKKNIPLEIKIIRKDKHSCAAEIIFPDLNLKKKLNKTTTYLKFLPKTTGKFVFTCKFKMLKGVLVIN